MSAPDPAQQADTYHFVGKETLVQMVFRRRLIWFNQERLHAKDRAETEVAEVAGGLVKPHRMPVHS